MPGGQPSKYKPEYCEMLIEHQRKGLSFESFGAEVSVSRRTLYDWVEAHPEFREAKSVALECCLKFWEAAGIVGMGMGKQFNAVVWIVNMGNRFGWSARPREEEPSSSVDHTPTEISDDTLLKLVDAARGDKA